MVRADFPSPASISFELRTLATVTHTLDNMADSAPRKRSRFDQTSPEPTRKSRFDRRSRSPERSPAPSAAADKDKDTAPVANPNAAAAAAAAAARINASIQNKKGIQHVDVPPINSNNNGDKKDGEVAEGPKKDEIYTQDGDYIKDIEVNDLRNRYTLTKGSTQKMVITHSPVLFPTDSHSPLHSLLVCIP